MGDSRCDSITQGWRATGGRFAQKGLDERARARERERALEGQTTGEEGDLPGELGMGESGWGST